MNSHLDPLGQFIDKTLKNLPARKAPASLESRVLAELTRRQALPWWHRSWSYWPAPIRWLFLLLSAALAAAVLFGSMGLFHSGSAEVVKGAFAGPIDRLQACWTALGSLGSVVTDLFKLLPMAWVYGVVGGIVLLYAFLLCVGATAYRTLWQSR